MRARTIHFSRSGVEEAAAVVRGGGLIVYPTDTVYGLGGNPRSEDAVARLFEAKRREAKPIPVLCDDLDTALKMADLNASALSLAKKHWPGALTIVAPMKVELPFNVHQGTSTVGVRVPDSRLCLLLLKLCGGCLTGTSANISGEPACRSAREAEAALGDAVDIILDGGLLRGRPSTVVRVVEGGIEVLREGPVRVNEKAVAG